MRSYNFKRTFNLPFENNVPNLIENHLNEVNLFKRHVKFLRRSFYMNLRRQKKLEVFSILQEHKNILWINMAAPSLGDSLMDLSSRALLKDKNLDLFTDSKNAHIYQSDLFFNKVFTSVKDKIRGNYDLVIIDSYSTRSIKIKSIIAPKVPFTGIYGYFNGPEVNRILFSFYQLNNLLGNIKSLNEIDSIAKNSITISEKDKEIVSNIIPKKYISIVLGGDWGYKVYESWDQVISKIITDNPNLNLILLGSDNANSMAKKILKILPTSNVYNFVDKLSFNQTVQVMKKSNLVFCCDGGLMHGANALNIKNITLFARLTPKMLLTNSANSFYLYDKSDVNNISSDEVISKFNQIVNQVL
jgi:ADP-heptose:LPS heptosyltransferase